MSGKTNFGIIYTMEYYSASKRNKVLKPATMWMNLGNIMLRKRSQTPNGKYCIIPLICSTWDCEIQRQKTDRGAGEEVIVII